MKANQTTSTAHGTRRPARLAAVIATLAFGASASCFAAVAGAGEAQDIALPNMHLTMVAATAITPTGETVAISREQVRNELSAARENGTMAVAGEIGDNSRTVLAARDRVNEQQAETLVAVYRAEQDRLIALQAEETRAALALQDALDASASAGSGGEEAYVPSGSGDEPVDTTGVRIDVIRVTTEIGAVKPEDELVVVSVEGGDETTQLDRAAAIRRQLGDMGVAQDQVYIEAVPERD